MIKSKSCLVYYLVIFSVIFISCIEFNIPFKPTPTSHSKWLAKLLFKPACSPPCWEQIIPGKTTIDEGLSVIKNFKDISITYLPTKGPNDNRKQMMWEFKNTSSGGSATTDKNGVVISDITLHIDSKEDLKINEIFTFYGPPEYVNIIGCFGEITRSSCDAHLVYPKIGMSVGLYLPDQGKDEHQVELTSNSNVRTIVFYNPGVSSYLEALGVFDNRITWSGYKEYQSKNP
jgi:hypothetical protein